MADKKAANLIKLSGNDYAKVAERIRLFREEWADGKIETDRITNEDGSVEFKAWIWKDKKTVIELMKSGVTDKDILRGSADADGSSKGEVGKKVKDFEKLQTIAVGRALANLGYLASGDVASFEEMEEFASFKSGQKAEKIKEAIVSFDSAKTLDELKAAFMASDLMNEPAVVAAKDKRKTELTTPDKGEAPPNADN